MINGNEQTNNQSLFDALTEIAPVAIFEFKNNQPHIKKINQIACQILGYTQHELLTINPYDLLDEQSRESLKERIKHILNGAKIASSIEYKIKAKNGEEIYAILNLKPFYQKGKLKNILAVLYDHTQTIKAQEELQKSEEKYRQIVELSPDGIITTTMTGTITSINKAFTDLTGYTKEEIIGKHFTKIGTLKATEIRNYLKIFASIIAGKVPEKIQFPYTTKDKTRRIAEARLVIIQQENKKISLLAILRDITQNKKAEETLQKSIQMTTQTKKELNLILDSTPTIIFYKNKEGKLKLVNEAFAKALNTTKENLIGKTVHDLYSTQIAQAMRNDDLIVMQAKKPKRGIIEPYNSPTGIGWIRTDKFPSFDENGNVNGIIGFSEDITESKKAQEDLIESEQKYRMLIETASEGIVLAQPDGAYAFINNRFAQMLGYTQQEILGKSSTDFLIEEKEKQKAIQNRKLIRAGQCVFGERQFRRKNGSTLWTAYNASPLFDKEGNPIAYMALYTDITERKKMETQLKEQERLAAIGATAAMVGHDIRNPLQAIMGDTYLLKKELTSIPSCKTKEAVAENVTGIEENINYINKIVADLQDYARTLNPNYTQINLAEIIQSVVKTIPIPPNIKTNIQTKPNQKTKTDPTYLRRILTNLINNAIQAMPNGGNLTIKTNTTTKKTTIIITDTGVGIPEHIKPKLFTPMITTKAKGQGLGLAVVKRLIEAQNGTITFQSKQQKGTKFTIQLPNTNTTKTTQTQTNQTNTHQQP